MVEIIYAHVGRVCSGYTSDQLQVVDLEGNPIEYVVEANSKERWYRKYRTRKDGSFFRIPGDELTIELVENVDFRIIVK